MREAVGYLLAVGLFVFLALRIFQAPAPITLLEANVSAESSKNQDIRGSFFGSLTLTEVNATRMLHHKIATVWGEPFVRDPVGTNIEPRKAFSDRDDKSVPVEENTTKQSNEVSSDKNLSRLPEKKPRYSVDFWLKSTQVEERESNRSGYNDPDSEIARLLGRIGASLGDPVFLRIFKTERQLEIWMEVDDRYELLKTVHLCRVAGEPGPKLDDEDGQFPEGFYQLLLPDGEEEERSSQILKINYPNRYDRFYGRSGEPVPLVGKCADETGVGISPREMTLLIRLIRAAYERGERAVGIHIFPFRMTDEAMRSHLGGSWYFFWENLRQGYSLFNRTHHLPRILVEDGDYTFRLEL